MSQENLSFGFPTRSDTNWAVQPQKMTRGLKFWIKEEEGLYYSAFAGSGSLLLMRGFQIFAKRK